MKRNIVIAILFLMFSYSTFSAPSKGLPFINDNFDNAVLVAKQRNLPLFVEVWAPW